MVSMLHHQEDNHMLTRLLPDQISKHWDVIKYAIEGSLPPVAGEGPEKMNKILMSLLNGKSQCWASYIIEDDVRRFEGIMVTKISHDTISDTRSLMIYCLYSYGKVKKSSWLTGLRTIAKYAISNDCDRIIGYTSVPFLVGMAKKLGGDTKHTFISLPLF